MRYIIRFSKWRTASLNFFQIPLDYPTPTKCCDIIRIGTKIKKTLIAYCLPLSKLTEKVRYQIDIIKI